MSLSVTKRNRIKLTLYSLDRFLNGDIGEMIHALQAADMEDRLAAANLSGTAAIGSGQ